MKSFGAMFGIGCGDSGCIWGATTGMHTNGGCRCFEDDRRTEEGRERRRRIHTGIRLLRELAEMPDFELALREFALLVTTRTITKMQEEYDDEKRART